MYGKRENERAAQRKLFLIRRKMKFVFLMK